MEETATCKCGNQTWYIRGCYAECSKCKFEIEFAVYSEESENRKMFADEIMDTINSR